MCIRDRLEEQLEFMEKNDYHLTYTSYYECSESGEIRGVVKCPSKLSYFDIFCDNKVGCLTAVYNVEKIGKHYMPTMKNREDWCLWIEIIKAHGTAFGLQKPLAWYRDRNVSLSSYKIGMLKWNYRVYREFLGYSAIKSAFFLCCLFLPHYFYKKIKQKLQSNNIKTDI